MHPCPECHKPTPGVFVREGEDSKLCGTCFYFLVTRPKAEFKNEAIGCPEEGVNRDFAAGNRGSDGPDGAGAADWHELYR